MIADTPRARNATNSMPIDDAEESVNMLSLFSLILFVNGTADEAADSNKYAINCKSITVPNQSMIQRIYSSVLYTMKHNHKPDHQKILSKLNSVAKMFPG